MEASKSMINMIKLSILAGLLSLVSDANALQVKVLDQAGEPLNGAAVWLEGNAYQPSKAQQQHTYQMGQRDRAFTPHTLIVPQNAEVLFPNFDSILHHVYSFSSPKQFELKLYKDTPKSAIKFDNQGVVELGCNIHDWMLGYILVINSGSHALTTEQGVAEISLSKEQLGKAKLHVWHERFEQLEKSETLIVEINSVDQVITYKLKQALLESFDFSGDETDDY